MASSLVLNFDILHQIFMHHVDDIPTLRSIAQTCFFGLNVARPHMFKFVCLPVENDFLDDVLKLVHDKPYLAAVAQAVRLVGVRREGLQTFPILDLETVDEVLATFPLAEEIEVRRFQWMRSDEVLVNTRTDLSLGMHSIYAHSPLANPIELIVAFGSLFRLSVSDIRLHPEADSPMEFDGNVSASFVEVHCVDDPFRNALDALQINDVAELYYKSLQYFHLSMVQFTADFGSWTMLSRLKLELTTQTWPSSAWRNVGIAPCERLEELVIIISLPSAATGSHNYQDIALFNIIEQTPPSLRYLDIVFSYVDPAKMTSYSSQAAAFDWPVYSEVLRSLPSFSMLGLSVVHRDPAVQWQESDVVTIKNWVVGVPLEFYSSVNLLGLSWWY